MNAPLQLAESVADFSSAEHLVRVERLLEEVGLAGAARRRVRWMGS